MTLRRGGPTLTGRSRAGTTTFRPCAALRGRSVAPLRLTRRHAAQDVVEYRLLLAHDRHRGTPGRREFRASGRALVCRPCKPHNDSWYVEELQLPLSCYSLRNQLGSFGHHRDDAALALLPLDPNNGSSICAFGLENPNFYMLIYGCARPGEPCGDWLTRLSVHEPPRRPIATQS